MKKRERARDVALSRARKNVVDAAQASFSEIAALRAKRDLEDVELHAAKRGEEIAKAKLNAKAAELELARMNGRERIKENPPQNAGMLVERADVPEKPNFPPPTNPFQQPTRREILLVAIADAEMATARLKKAMRTDGHSHEIEAAVFELASVLQNIGRVKALPA